MALLPPAILFCCDHNAVRSPMAEGVMKRLYGTRSYVQSAGVRNDLDIDGFSVAVCREIGRWTSQVELEEAMVASQLQVLDEQLQAVLPSLGYRLASPKPDEAAPEEGAADGTVTRPPNVVAMGPRPAAE